MNQIAKKLVLKKETLHALDPKPNPAPNTDSVMRRCTFTG